MDFFSRLVCYDMVEDENYIYYYVNEKNLLCKLDKDTKENHILREFDENLFFSYSCIQKVNEKLILTPWCANDILIYDLKIDVVYKIPIEILNNFMLVHYEGNDKFWNSFVFRDSVYMLGFCYPAIIKLDTLTLKTEYLTDWYDYIRDRRKKDAVHYFFQGEVIGNEAWISCSCCNMMVKLNLENMRFEYYTISSIDIGCGAFLYDGKYFWIGEWGANFEKLICWNPKENIEKKFEIAEKITDEWCPIRSIIDDDNLLHIFSFGNADVYQLEKNGGLIQKSEINSYCDCEKYKANGWKIIAFVKNETDIRYITRDCIWHEYELKNKKHISYKVKVNDIRVLESIISKQINKNRIIYERHGILHWYFKGIANRKKRLLKDNGLIGKNIFNIINMEN